EPATPPVEPEPAPEPAPAAEPEPARMATLTLTSNPPGAQVEETERGVLGTTPVEVKFEVGKRIVLTFTANGYEPLTRRWLVTSDHLVNVALKAKRDVP